MSPEELQLMVQNAVSEGVSFPWWAYFGALLLFLAGAYIGSYMRLKGEARANKDGFSDVLEQLRKTTHDTESIRNSLAGLTWVTQQQWAVRETNYVGLLTHLTKLKLSLQDRNTQYIKPGSEHDDTIAETPYFQRLWHVGDDAYQAIRELIGPASIFLSDRAIGALEALVRDHWGATEHSSCAADYVATALRLVEIAQDAVLAEAKKDLAHWQPSATTVAGTPTSLRS